jgi:lysine-specific demethylase 8/hypoxia-inducible factor 1-alpha inhibitor (HIF hydroxylase)
MSSVEDGSVSKLGHSAIAFLSAAQITPASFFETYRRSGTPVAITGMLKDLPNWNLDYLCQQFGDRRFPIRRYGSERYQIDKRYWHNMGSAVETHTLPFSEYAALLQDGTAKEQDLYLGKCSLKQTALADSKQFQSVETGLGLTAPVTDYNLWLGVGGHTTCLHCDAFDGILIQLIGMKRILLFPPQQLPNLYAFPISSHLWAGSKRRASYSQVYPEQPDFDSFPRFRAALQQKSEVILNPGDVLFIPVGWWHEVISVGEGVVCSVNRFWSVLPRSRALHSWNKWRIHLGSVLSVPHLLWTGLPSLLRPTRLIELNQFWQKL